MQIDRILTDSMTLIADRFDRGGYPFIDTKFDIVTGRDFGENDEPFRRKECVYAWIQGRGLESLAKHILYFRQNGNPGDPVVAVAVFSGGIQDFVRKNLHSLPP